MWKNFWRQIGEILDDVVNRPFGYFISLCALIFVWSVDEENFVTFFALLVAAFFAYRRAVAVEQQLQESQKSGLNERFNRLNSMLDSTSEAVQIGGIIGLNNLAKEQNEKYSYKKDVFEVVCAFIRGKQNIVKEVKQYAINMFFKKENDGIFYSDMSPADLTGADLQVINLEGVDLSNAILDGANLSNARFSDKSIFCGASLKKSIISSSEGAHGDFTDCKFQGATVVGRSSFVDAILINANFEYANVHEYNFSKSLKSENMEGITVPEQAHTVLVGRFPGITIKKGGNPGEEKNHNQ